MSLRTHLYGWSYESFVRVLGSNNAAVLKAAAAHLSEAFKDESLRARGEAWLRTLIENSFPLAADREPPSPPDDGGLLVLQMETEVHVIAFHCIVRAIAHDDYLDLANESSDLVHPAAHSLFREIGACGFTDAAHLGNEYWARWMRLLEGTPLFGDDFDTPSFYTWFSNQDLAETVPIFQAAAEFERPYPKSFEAQLPETRERLQRSYKTSLSEGGKAAATALSKWFGQIQRAGQDAFILWS